MMNNKLERRDFFRTAGLGMGAVMGAAMTGAMPIPTAHAATESVAGSDCKRNYPSVLAADRVQADYRARSFVYPSRLVWQSDDGALEQGEHLVKGRARQSTVMEAGRCVLRYKGKNSGFLLDFGCELHGGIQVIARHTESQRPVRLRVRFGESVTEAMDTPNQDHAIHDTEFLVPWAGTAEIGNTGFRFARIDMVEEGWVELLTVRAVLLCLDLEYQGAFECSDARLNQIWQTGAYTVHLNMQDHVWDGIKRDRLVWMGDLHPEAMIISMVFGGHEIVPRTLDFARDEAPLPQFMNGMFSYSLWWIIIQRDWYLYHGQLAYLEGQREYLRGLLKQLDGYTEDNVPQGFLDWPTSPYPEAVQSGMRALLALAFRAGAKLSVVLKDPELQELCLAGERRWSSMPVSPDGVKTVAAMMVLAGMLPANTANETILAVDPLRGVSTFYGYYVLQARARAGDYAGCLEVIRKYWGAMLDFGATTFWEDFNLDWTANAARIDEIVPPGKADLHKDFGDFCYKGLRHSLCHGWAGGPTAWMSEHVLGFRPLEPGCRKLLIEPHLAGLEWARGAFPTPQGIVRVNHTLDSKGNIVTEVQAPTDMEIVCNTLRNA